MDIPWVLFPKWMLGLISSVGSLRSGLSIAMCSMLCVNLKGSLNSLHLRSILLILSPLSQWPVILALRLFRKLLLSSCILIQFKSRILICIHSSVKTRVFLRFCCSLKKPREHQWSIRDWVWHSRKNSISVLLEVLMMSLYKSTTSKHSQLWLW